MDQNIQLLKGDCLEIMKSIPDKSIDMILCDLPYGTTRNKWDGVIPLNLLWEQYERIIKDNGCIALFGQPPFDKVLGCSNLKLLKYEWIWEKSHATGHLNAKKMPMKKHENILIFYRQLPTYNAQLKPGKPYKDLRTEGKVHSSNYGKQTSYKQNINDGWRYPTDILQFKAEKHLHPTQKPTPLLEYLIKTYTNENEVVLDNCMGSGSTGIACINTKRQFIGIELDKKYFDIASERLGVK